MADRATWRRVLPEVALVTAVALVQLVPTGILAHVKADHTGDFGVAGAGLLLLGIAALPFRRRYPSGVLAVALATTTAYWSLGYSRGPVWFTLIIALINAVLAGRRRAAIAAVVVGYICIPWLGYAIGRNEEPNLIPLILLAGWLVALMSMGEIWRYRRERAAEMARSEAEAARRRASEERLRIANELHDVVAHNMSLISIQAGVALHLMDSNPDQARTSLAAIKEASKEALVELRSILGVLRVVDDESDVSAAAPRAPVPTLQRVDDLVERARAAGLDVQLEIGDEVGDLADLPRQVDLAAFRIVQESLTNVARHSDDRAATVRISGRDGGLAVDILDEGSGHSAHGVDLPRGGNGLVGMRERAASVGGRLEAGPRPGQGFAVRAWLPIVETDDGGSEEQGS